MNRAVLLKWASSIALAILVAAGVSLVSWSCGEARGYTDGYRSGVEQAYSIGYDDGKNGVLPDARRAHGNFVVGVHIWPW